MATWEYARLDTITYDGSEVVIRINNQVQSFDESRLEPFGVLNEMGAEGWELIAVDYSIPPSPDAVEPRFMREYLLKRERVNGAV